MEHIAGKTLDLNAIGVCNIALDRPVAFAPYAENHDLGGFILIDRMTNTTVGAGIIHYALRRSQNIHWRSEEHTSELQSLMRISYAVFCLKKKIKIQDKEQQNAQQNKNTH